jgi:hypothetical protein
MKISSYIIYLEMQPNALLLHQNFDLQKVSVTDVHRPGPQYLACSISKIKHTCLGYRNKLSRLCFLDLPLAPVVPRGGHLVERTLKQKVDHRPLGRMRVPQIRSTHDRIAQLIPATCHGKQNRQHRG